MAIRGTSTPGNKCKRPRLGDFAGDESNVGVPSYILATRTIQSTNNNNNSNQQEPGAAYSANLHQAANRFESTGAGNLDYLDSRTNQQSYFSLFNDTNRLKELHCR